MEKVLEHVSENLSVEIFPDDKFEFLITTNEAAKGFVRLIPANKSPEFCEQEIPVEMIRRVFAVLGSIRKFF